LTGEWINRYVNFWGWTFYPINEVWPTVLPIMLVTFPAAAQYFFWVHFRPVWRDVPLSRPAYR